jgi:hypothetical protein
MTGSNATKRRTLVVAVAAALIAAAAGIAYAAIPGSNGVISACYAKDGDLRVIDAATGAKCKSGETALSWNQQGPTGAPGVLDFYTREKGIDIPPHEDEFEDLDCDPGDRATGGGFAVDPVHLEDVRVPESTPINDLVGGKLTPFRWQVVFINSSDSSVGVQFSIVCADLTP